MDAGDIKVKSTNSVNISESGVGSGTSGEGDAGDIKIKSTDFVNISSRISSTTSGEGEAGSIVLDVDNLSISDRGFITSKANSDSFGNAGDITITAKDSVNISSDSWISSGTHGEGDGGKVVLDVRNLSLTDAGSISTNCQYEGSGNAGDITIIAKDSVNISSDSWISSYTSGEGDAGKIDLDVGNLTLTDSGEIVTGSFFSSGNAGNINITATNFVNISKSRIVSRTRGIGKGDKDGDAGTIVLDVGSLTLTDTAYISTDATEFNGIFSSGKAGSINITATDSVNMSGESFVSSSALGEGDGGIVTISAGDMFQSDNSKVKTFAEKAKGGDISITAGHDVLLRNGTVVSSESSGAKNAGDITINAGNMYKSENSSITTEAEKASGGSINLTAQYMAHLIDSEITSSVGGGTDTVGGNITMNQPYGVLDNSKIIAQANEGKWRKYTDYC